MAERFGGIQLIPLGLMVGVLELFKVGDSRCGSGRIFLPAKSSGGSPPVLFPVLSIHFPLEESCPCIADHRHKVCHDELYSNAIYLMSNNKEVKGSTGITNGGHLPSHLSSRADR